MHQENPEQANNIEIRGLVASDFTFSHEVYGEGFYSFLVKVPRLSQTEDFLPVTISERLIDKQNLPLDTFVHISAQVRSYNNYVQSDNRNRLIITVFARDIKIIEKDAENLKLSPNTVFLNGYICKPPVLRQTPFGREIADILLAVNRPYNKSDYIPCICWGRNARFVSSLLVGDNVKISGRMQSRNYQKKLDDTNIIEKTAYEISVGKIELVDKDVPVEDAPVMDAPVEDAVEEPTEN